MPNRLRDGKDEKKPEKKKKVEVVKPLDRINRAAFSRTLRGIRR